MTSCAAKTVRETVTSRPVISGVFQQFNMDPSSANEGSFRDASAQNGILSDLSAGRLDTVPGFTRQHGSERLWPRATQLIDYLVTKHHNYTRNTLELLTRKFISLSESDLFTYPGMSEIRDASFELFTELKKHMTKEEENLFPFIRDLEMSVLHSFSLAPVSFVTIANPVHTARREHAHELEMLERIRCAVNRYRTCREVSAEIRDLFKKMKEFEDDLLQHLHLEDNVLFPFVIAMESRLYFES